MLSYAQHAEINTTGAKQRTFFYNVQMLQWLIDLYQVILIVFG